MTTHSRSRGKPVVLGALIATLLLPGLVWAHAELTKSEPGAKDVLTVLPKQLRLWFSEAPEVAVTTVDLVGPDSSHVALGKPGRMPDNPLGVTAPILGALKPGRYTVVWRTAAADGHPSHGSFSFYISTEAVPAPARDSPQSRPVDSARVAVPAAANRAPKDDSEHAFDAQSPGFVLIRWVSFLAIMSTIGAAMFRVLVLGRLRRREPESRSPVLVAIERGVASLGTGAAVLLILVGIARLLAESLAMDRTAVLETAMVATMVLHTTWGIGWIAQIALAVVALFGFLAARAGRELGWSIAIPSTVLLAFTPALGGHAVSSASQTTLAVLADGLHVLGASGWVGSLFALVTVAIPRAIRQDQVSGALLVADVVSAFSPIALSLAAMLALTGAFAAWLHLGSLHALVESSYGHVLLFKLAMVSLVLATGAYNWRRVKPLLGTDAASRLLGRSATIELLIGATVVLLTAVLVGTPLPSGQ